MSFNATITETATEWSGFVKQKDTANNSQTLAELKAICKALADRSGDTTLGTAIGALSPGAATNVDTNIYRNCSLTQAQNGFCLEVTLVTIATRKGEPVYYIFPLPASGTTAIKVRTALRDALAQVASSFGHGPLASAISGITP